MPPGQEEQEDIEETRDIEEQIKAEQDVDCGPWQVECCKLNAQLGTMLERGLWTDCELLVGKEAVCFVAHRALLAGASPVFAAMLYGPHGPITDVPFRLPSVEPETFQLVLRYIYTDHTVINSCEMACNLYKAAEYFNMPHLKSKTKMYLLNYVTPVTVLYVFEFSQMYEEGELKKKCLEIMTEETVALLKGPGVEVASAQTLEQLFALPELAINSELELVEAADRWVRAHTKIKPSVSEQPDKTLSTSAIKPISAVWNDKVDEDDPKVLIRKALQQIRFLTINAKKFVEYDTTNILNGSDMLAITFNMQSRKSFVPMPTGFNISMETRRKQIFTIRLQKMSKFMDEIKVYKYGVKYSNRCYIGRKLPWFFKLIHKRSKLYWSIMIVDPDWRTYNKVLCKACITVKLRHKLNEPPLELPTAKVEFEKNKISTERDNCYYIAAIPQLCLKDLMDPRNGYLHDDTVRFEVKIVNELLAFDSIDTKQIVNGEPE